MVTTGPSSMVPSGETNWMWMSNGSPSRANLVSNLSSRFESALLIMQPVLRHRSGSYKFQAVDNVHHVAQQSIHHRRRCLLRIVADRFWKRLWICEVLMTAASRTYPSYDPRSCTAGFLVHGHRCFQCRDARFDVFDLDGLGCVIEDCLCRSYFDGSRRRRIDHRLQQRGGCR